MAIAIFFAGLLFTVLLLGAVQLQMSSFWKDKTATYGVGRIEKACDSVTSVVGLLIPATAAIATWLYEKAGSRLSAAFLTLGTLFFLALLAFTSYIRFNWLWQHTLRVKVGQNENLILVRWQASAMVLITAGLACLTFATILVLFQGGATQIPKPAQQPQSIHNESHNSLSYNEIGRPAPHPKQPCSKRKPHPPRPCPPAPQEP